MRRSEADGELGTGGDWEGFDIVHVVKEGEKQNFRVVSGDLLRFVPINRW